MSNKKLLIASIYVAMFGSIIGVMFAYSLKAEAATVEQNIGGSFSQSGSFGSGVIVGQRDILIPETGNVNYITVWPDLDDPDFTSCAVASGGSYGLDIRLMSDGVTTPFGSPAAIYAPYGDGLPREDGSCVYEYSAGPGYTVTAGDEVSILWISNYWTGIALQGSPTSVGAEYGRAWVSTNGSTWGAYDSNVWSLRYVISINEVDPPPPDIPTNTFISITYPTFSTSTASTTFDVLIDYGIGTDLAYFSPTGELPDDIGIEILIIDTFSGEQYIFGPDFTIDSDVGEHSYTLEVTLPQSNYSITANLVGNYGTIPVPEGCTPILPFITCTETVIENNLASDVVGGFSVNNGLYGSIGFEWGSPQSQLGLATTTCSVTQLGGCVQNALVFVFSPSPDALNSFQNSWERIKNKPPFGYVTQTIGALQGLTTSGTPAFVMPEDLPFIDEIFDPIRTSLAAILWLIFGVVFFQRLTKIDI